MPDSAVIRLTFLLPDIMVLRAQPGRHCPCLHGCVLVVDRRGLVTIEGPSREQVFDQARRFLRTIIKGLPPTSIAAVLTTLRMGPNAKDTLHIVTGAEITFAFTSVEPAVA
jgi:hypothetical protein